jgi:LysM repeat protein
MIEAVFTKVRSIRRLLLPLSVVLVIAGCGGSSGGETSSEPTGAPVLVIVTMTPIPPGATVVITPTPTIDPATLRTHTVAEGESISSISELYNVSQDELLELNGIDDPNSLFAGQELLIPPD